MPTIDITKMVICDVCWKTSAKGVQEPIYALRVNNGVLFRCCWDCLLDLQEAVNDLMKEEINNGSE